MKRIFTITLITLLISSCTFGQEVKKPIFKKVNLGGGDYYEGYMLNGKKEGKGKLFIKNDGIFEGAFKNDKFHGFGKWTMYDGEILEQEYKDDRTVGLVKRTKNGIVTYGNFENNEFVEDKTFAFKANPDLSTENKNEKITPKTPFKDFDVDKLIDELTAYNTKEDSLKKLSEKINGVTTEYKTLTYENGDVYVGNALNNIPEGQGKKTYKNGVSADGNWVNGKLNGNGTEIYKSGASYIGNYKNGVKSGKGIYIYEDGNIYDGDFLNDQQNGFGKFTSVNTGVIVECEYKDGIQIGRVKYTFKDGSIEFRTFDKNGKIIKE